MKTQLLLHRLGLHATYKGYHYFSHALSLAAEDETYLTGLTTRLYPAVARHFGSSSSSVERSLRTLIAVFWQNGSREYFEKISCCRFSAPPCTGAFISILVRYLKLT